MDANRRVNYAIVKVSNGSEQVLAQNSGGVMTRNSFHNIGFKMQGSRLELFLDGQSSLTANDASHTTGRGGIYSKARLQRIDNLKLKIAAS